MLRCRATGSAPLTHSTVSAVSRTAIVAPLRRGAAVSKDNSSSSSRLNAQSTTVTSASRRASSRTALTARGRSSGHRSARARPVSTRRCGRTAQASRTSPAASRLPRSEEHTSELQSHSDLVCRLLLEKKKKNNSNNRNKKKQKNNNKKQ